MSARWRFEPRVFELGDVQPLDALSALRERSGLVLLDSAAGTPRRHSILAFDPLPAPASPPRSLRDLRELWRTLELRPHDPVPGPFHGGLLALLPYDLGIAGERAVATAPEPWGEDQLIAGLYVDFIVRDELSSRAWLVLGHAPGDGRAPVEERREALLAELASAPRAGPIHAQAPLRHVPSAEHLARIERCRAAIARGEIYQANLAHRFTCEAQGDPIDWYARLRAVNPAPYMCFARWRDAVEGERALLSASPELLLEYDGELARTRPIKGTARRSVDAELDARAARELLESPKDRAELAMIVDLERNDLARVCEPRGVWVEGFPTLASYARVHHLMADVVGRPRAGLDAFDLLGALFPGGSVTGAPKLRAMEWIAALEGEGRGLFCGSAGYVDARGRANWNILIRTLVWRGRSRAQGQFSFRVGGGITWPSDAHAEERETLDKAQGLLDALCEGPARVASA